MKRHAKEWAALVALSLAFHAVYTFSIFDVYFRSPLVHGTKLTRPPAPTPAKRLVVVSADGLRADKLFERRLERAPFVRELVAETGAARWGVSHTRVPTESRPGHVAMLAGFYEDVSAVTTGWKLNPVEFDSILNESTACWAFGSYDIVPMFVLGATGAEGRVHMEYYASEETTFAGGRDDPRWQDDWVLERFSRLLARARGDAGLYQQLSQPGVVIFLHLLATDTYGHAYRPDSPQYEGHVTRVDAAVRNVTESLASFFGHDDATAFVLTSDHGMAAHGVHGDGDPHNTQTPLVVWGAGIASASGTAAGALGRDNWGLGDRERVDVAQADLTPLMATLVGIPIPKNSVGVLPTALLGDQRFAARALLQNARQLWAGYTTRLDAKRREMWTSLASYSPLEGTAKLLDRLAAELEDSTVDHDAVVAQLNALCAAILDGNRYLQTYDWLLLRSVVAAGYVGWMLYAAVQVAALHAGPAGLSLLRRPSMPWIALGTLFAVFLAGLLAARSAAPLYYAYAAFPVYYWTRIAASTGRIAAAAKSRAFAQSLFQTVGTLALVLFALELLVAAYFYRWVLGALVLVLGWIWPLSWPRGTPGSTSWRLLASATAVPLILLPPVQRGNNAWMLVGIALALVATVASAGRVGASRREMRFRASLIAAAGALVGLHAIFPRGNVALQTASWLFGTCTIVLVAIGRGWSASETIAGPALAAWRVLVGLAPLYVLLGITYELAFYTVFAATVAQWAVIEARLGQRRPASSAVATAPTRPLELADVRRALVFLVWVNVAFFGTGNMASLASFQLESVYRFTTQFRPFLMGALLIVKIMVPFLAPLAITPLLARALRLRPFSLPALALAFADVSTLTFFFLVRDEGSWLEIGTSISHFVISSALLVLVLLLYGLATWLVGGFERGLFPVQSRERKRW